MMLWTEPANEAPVPRGGGTRNGSHISTTSHLNHHYSPTYLKQRAYSEIRRFVVISQGHGSNICSWVTTFRIKGRSS